MIQDAVRYIRGLPRKPWLVLGKGPSAMHAGITVSLDPYHVLTLNHACQLALGLEVRPALAHFIDLEAFDACSERLARFEIPTCLPWYPHEEMKPVAITLLGRCTGCPPTRPDLVWLNAKEKLYAYNGDNVAGFYARNRKLTLVHVRISSAVAAFNLLGTAGIKQIHTLGIDGGKEYASCFDTRDRLANGRQSFDDQNVELAVAVRKHGMRWDRLGA